MAVIDLTIEAWELFQANEKQHQQESRERLRREVEAAQAELNESLLITEIDSDELDSSL